MLSYLKYRFKNLINYSKRQNGVTNILLSRQNYENIKDIRDAEIKVFSQNGEDGIIDFILKKLNIGDLKFIEVGVEDYEESNTRFLVETRPTTGLLIDNCKEINFIKRRDFFWKNELYLENTEVSPENINSILKKNNFFKSFDLFSIDIDGLDYWVLKEIDFSKATMVVLEYNPLFGFEKLVSIPNIKNFSRNQYSKFYFGASLKAYIELMKNKNYSFLGSNSFCNNAFFVNNKFAEIFHDIEVKDLSNYCNFKFREKFFNDTKDYKIEMYKEIQDFELFDFEKNENEIIGKLFKI